MSIKFLKGSDKHTIEFIWSNAYPELVNAVRRALISEVPVMAVSKVNFFKNNSALYNEMLALRLGLLPLTTDAKTYVLPSDCSCKGKGCNKCRVILTCEVEGPGMVYARDLKSTDPNVKPVHPEMPLVKLFEGQRVKFEAEAVLGLGTSHARFNGAMASYQYYPKITTGNCKCKAAVNNCPRGVLEMKGGKVSVKDLEQCNLCLACVDACDCDDFKVEGQTNKFIFKLESWGQHEPKKMVKLAIDQLLERTNELSKLVLK